MLDGHYKALLDKAWDRIAHLPVWIGLTANQITWIGLILMGVVCVAYVISPDALLFGMAIIGVAAFDSLDGAVARITGSSSSYGGYLDAMADRCQEIMVLAALGQVHQCWAMAFLALGGSMLVSYAKARTAVECPINNTAWPDLMERMERVLFISVSLILSKWIAWDEFIPAMLLVLGGLTLYTTVQRFIRARALLMRNDAP